MPWRHTVFQNFDTSGLSVYYCTVYLTDWNNLKISQQRNVKIKTAAFINISLFGSFVQNKLATYL